MLRKIAGVDDLGGELRQALRMSGSGGHACAVGKEVPRDALPGVTATEN